MNRKRKGVSERSVENLKTLLGDRIKNVRIAGEATQDAVAVAGKVSRRIVGEVERADSDYRIESYLAVLSGLEELRLIPSATDFALEPISKALHSEVGFVLTNGSSDDIQYLMTTLRRIIADIEPRKTVIPFPRRTV